MTLKSLPRMVCLAISMNILLLSSTLNAATSDSIYSTNFTQLNAVSDWSNINNVRFGTDTKVGNYMVTEGAIAASAAKSANFTAGEFVCVEFDMMLPTKKSDGVTDNTIGGGNTGGIALMNGNTVAGVIGFRGSGTGSSDHILSNGGTGSDYVSITAGAKATAYRDMLLHYTFLVNTTTKKGDFYVTNPTDGKVYPQVGRYDKYIANISAVTNIGIVSNAGFSIGIANLRVNNPKATSMTLTAENNLTYQYIPAEGYTSTLQFVASPKFTICYNSGNKRVPTSTSVDLTGSTIAFSILDQANNPVQSTSGIAISSTGLLSVYSTATPGNYKIKATSDSISTILAITIKTAESANQLSISGEDVIISDQLPTTHIYKATPAFSGIILPERPCTWSIEGESLGCSMDSTTGTLTIPANGSGGNILLKAVLNIEKVITTFRVQIRTSEMINSSPYNILGAIFENGKIPITEATGIIGVIIEKNDSVSSLNNKLFIKAYNDKDQIIAQYEHIFTENDLKSGIQDFEPESTFTFSNASYIKAYIENNLGIIISKDINPIVQGSYKGLPLVSNWVTHPTLGNGPGVLTPTKVPAGIDPILVNTKTSNVTYQYNANYPTISSDNQLWYKTGAYSSTATIYDRESSDWQQQALPIGNGYMGGMIFGMPGKDHIQFNEETFWGAGYRGVQTTVASNYVNPNMSEGINGFLNTGDIFVDFKLPSNPTITNYYRDLNLDDAIAHVQYEYNKVKFKREYFASYPDQVMLFRYTADSTGALNFTVNPVSAHPGKITVKDGIITITGHLKDAEPYSGGGNAVYSQKSDLEYCTQVKIIADDGRLIDHYGNVEVQGATGVTIVVASSTDYDPKQFTIGSNGNVDMTVKPFKSLQGVQYAIDKTNRRISNVNGKTYQQIKSEHISDYQNLFNRVKFTLTDENEVCQTPTNELQSSYKNAIPSISAGSKITISPSTYPALNKHLEELHYNYARYLMISSSREATMPANLQGKWNQSVAQIWGSAYCININLEMNYWFAGGANLPESGKALINWMQSQIPAGSITAKNMYKITPKSYTLNGHIITFSTITSGSKEDVFIGHTKQSINGQTDMTGSTSIQSIGNTAFMMYNVWDLYLSSGDKQWLANDLYPIMRQAANFYTQLLYANKKTSLDTSKYPNGYYYTTNSGRSPEQGPTQEGIKYDLQLVAGMFDYTIQAAEILGIDSEKVAAWKEIRNNLDLPIELGADGQIKEWAQEVNYNTNSTGTALGDPYHRHISHLVGLYPGTLINRNTPDLIQGAKVTLDKRGDEATGWSVSNKFLMWTRVLDGAKALQLFRYQLAQKTYGNLFDYHAPFQIDGNFGSAAGVMELLMQSQTGILYILPCLPTVWSKGSISGIKAKNGAEVSIKWSNNKADEVLITPASDGDLKIGYDLADAISVFDGVNTNTISKENGYFTIPAAKSGSSLKINLISSALNPLKSGYFKIYPNPSSGRIHIQSNPFDLVTNGELKVRDVTSRLVYKTDIKQSDFSVDLTRVCKDGVYILQLLDKNSTILENRKIIITGH